MSFEINSNTIRSYSQERKEAQHARIDFLPRNMWDTFWLTVSDVSAGHFEPGIENQDAANLINMFKAFVDRKDSKWVDAVRGMIAARNAPIHVSIKGMDVKEFNPHIKSITSFFGLLRVDEMLWKEKFKNFEDWANFKIEGSLLSEDQRNNIRGALMSEGDELALSDLNSAEAEGWAKDKVEKKKQNAANEAKAKEREKRVEDHGKRKAENKAAQKVAEKLQRYQRLDGLNSNDPEFEERPATISSLNVTTQAQGEGGGRGDDKPTFEVRRGKFFEVVCGGILF